MPEPMSKRDALRKGEHVNAFVYEYALNRTVDLYAEAVKRGIINYDQSGRLMALWIEFHPYEPLDEPESEDAEQ
jgi:hypothetical protein